MLLVLITILGLSIGYSALNTDLSISGDAVAKKRNVYTEDILNGTDPVLQDELIPVIIEDDGTVRKANIYSEWYNYEKQEWANAVILVNEDTNYNANDVIPENNIESYFVWIPRYKYKIFDEGNYNGLTIKENAEQTIEVIFENKDTLVSNGTKEGEWLTHPAFTSFDSNGMWVGKFETGTTLTSDYNVRNGNAVHIKPNLTSWRNIQVANAFYTSYDYKRNLDSHMMKNTEWGAVAYLQHSIYGSSKEVFSNNNSSYITGYSTNKKPTCGYTGTNEDCNRYCNDGSCNSPYNTSIGYLASTTSNISGIYDMSGGSWEYVMGVMLDETGVPFSGRNEQANSGFKGNYSDGGTGLLGYDYPSSKYYDSYHYTTLVNDFKTRIMGDATGEIGPFYNETYYGVQRTVSSWYSDYAIYLRQEYVWFLRGGIIGYGTYNGIYAFSNMTGMNNNSISFRIVLTPKN